MNSKQINAEIDQITKVYGKMTNKPLWLHCTQGKVLYSILTKKEDNKFEVLFYDMDDFNSPKKAPVFEGVFEELPKLVKNQHKTFVIRTFGGERDKKLATKKGLEIEDICLDHMKYCMYELSGKGYVDASKQKGEIPLTFYVKERKAIGFKEIHQYRQKIESFEMNNVLVKTVFHSSEKEKVEELQLKK